MKTEASSIVITFIFISSVWQGCLGLSCYSCSTLVDNGVTKPGNQTCDLFHASSGQERRKFVEDCPSGVKACSHSEKRGLVGQSSGSSYDIIQKGCYGRSWVNSAKLNTCEDVGGAGGKKERICLCDSDLCEMDPSQVDSIPERKSEAGESARITKVFLCFSMITITRNF